MDATTFRTTVPGAAVLLTPDCHLVGVSFAQGPRAAEAERLCPGCTQGFVPLTGQIPECARRLDLKPAAPIVPADPIGVAVRFIEH